MPKEDDVKKDEKVNAYIKSIKEVNEAFTEEDLLACWKSLSEGYKEQIHLYNTLSQNTPVLKNDNIVVIKAENSVEEEKLRLAKPEIIGFLRRNLKNSFIDVQVKLIKASNNKKILTDEQKLQAMLQKNPALQLFKNKFNLDFNT